MDTRYQHPEVLRQWHPVSQYTYWARIHALVAQEQRVRGIIPPELTVELVNPLPINSQDVKNIQAVEKKTRHDVAAFVEYSRMRRGQLDAGRWVHYGLTSSDLVDTAMALRFKALRPFMRNSTAMVLRECTRWQRDGTMVLGRTHGQPAEPMPFGARADHWGAMLAESISLLRGAMAGMAHVKLSGPVGTFAYNPPDLEAAVAIGLELHPAGDRSSQIVPRSGLAAWASAAAGVVNVCGKIATDIRLMNMMGEAGEPHTPGQVGSSSMPHKNNPVRAEQICGMGRLARGYAEMLQPVDLWLERDISHSCVERVAIPDLWHVLLHTLDQTHELLRNLELNRPQIRVNLERTPEAMSARFTLDWIQGGKSAEDARAIALRESTTRPTAGEITWFGRNYNTMSLEGK